MKMPFTDTLLNLVQLFENVYEAFLNIHFQFKCETIKCEGIYE